MMERERGDSRNALDKTTLLLAHADTLQKNAERAMANIPVALKTAIAEHLDGKILSGLHTYINAAIANANAAAGELKSLSADLHSASEQARNTCVELKTAWIKNSAVAFVTGCVILMLFGAISYIMVIYGKQELAELRRRIAFAEQTANELKTWDVELKEYDNGERWIILPPGTEYLDTGRMKNDNRTAVRITGRMKQ
jgi:hypothetical protein